MPRLTTLRHVNAEAARHGAKVEKIHDGFEAFAPKGKLWSAAGAHSMVCILAPEDPETWLTGAERSAALADLVERMTLGLFDCNETDCECVDGDEA